MTPDEEAVVTKVRDLMTTLDRVKQYRAIASSLTDFVLVFLSTLAVALSFYLFIDYLQFAFGIGYGYSLWPSVLSLAAASLVLAGLFGGILVADRKVKRVKAKEWEPDLKEGFPGAVKILTSFDWNAAIFDVQTAKLGFLMYGALKVVGYTVALSVLLSIGFLALGNGILHLALSPVFSVAVSLILVLAAESGDLKRRYHESYSMDSLIWELRWFYSGFARSEFKA